MADGTESRRQLVERHRGLVGLVVRRFTTPSSQPALVDDLWQAGIEALLEGIDTFDPARGYRLGTYVTWQIRTRVRSQLRALDDRPPSLSGHNVSLDDEDVGMGRTLSAPDDRIGQVVSQLGRWQAISDLLDQMGPDVRVPARRALENVVNPIGGTGRHVNENLFGQRVLLSYARHPSASSVLRDAGVELEEGGDMCPSGGPGSRGRYVGGCHCRGCRRANAVYQQQRRIGVPAEKPDPQLTFDAGDLLPAPGNWREEAACAPLGASFHEREDATEMCGTCPVFDDCRTYVATLDDPVGVWAGRSYLPTQAKVGSAG